MEDVADLQEGEAAQEMGEEEKCEDDECLDKGFASDEEKIGDMTKGTYKDCLYGIFEIAL